MKKGKGTGNTGTPAANAASRKKGNTPGSQRGRRGTNSPAAGMPSGDLVRKAYAVRQFVPTGGTTLENKNEGNGELPPWPRNESHSPVRS